jgi:hypothetical protein
MNIREGYVDSVNLDIVSKTLVYNVKRKKGALGIPSIDSVDEQDITFASGCPVVLSLDSGQGETDGEIVFVNPVNGTKEISYIVKYDADDGIRIEHDVSVDRLKYRETLANRSTCRTEQSANKPGKNVVPISSPSASDEENSKDPNDSSHMMSLDQTLGPKCVKKTLAGQKKPSIAQEDSNHSRTLMKTKKRPRERQGNNLQREANGGQAKRKSRSRNSFQEHFGDERYARGTPGDLDTGRKSDSTGVHNIDSSESKSRAAESSPEKTFCWELPHIWHENDGAI